MSNQINEGAARYKVDNDGTNPPVPSATQAPAAGKEQRSPQQLVTDHLDLWTSTVTPKSASGRGRGSGKSSKLELTGIKKLRELILELAVRGKLVAQNPNDEPASKLLERIEAEKVQLIKDGKLKKQKLLAAVSDDEKPFELPEGWEWVYISSIGHDHGQTTPSTEFTYIDVGAIDNGRGRIKEPSVLQASEAPSRARKVVRMGTVIYSTVRPYLKNIAVIDEDFSPPPIASTAFAILHPWSGISSSYISSYLHSPSFVRYVESVQTGIAYPAINDKQFFGGVFPLPPSNEQQRIVAKVDELMALCDQLEQQSEHQLTAHQQLTDTLLGTLLQPAAGALTESADATTKSSQKEQLNDNWQRLAQHFDLLLAGPMGAWAIDRLKDTILQLAVMGKLVPQNPDDEPASELLERIEEEKTRLVKEGKIKKPKKLPPVSEEEKPFELPEGWEWVKFASVVSFESELVRPEDFQDYDQVAPDSIEKGTGNLLFRRTVKESGVKGPNNRFYSGQILYSKIRPSLSKAIIAEFDGLCSADMYPLRPHTINTEYLLRAILSEPFLIQVRKEENRIKMPKLNIPTLSNFCIPLPPLTEQHRIVAKVDELFGLCDQLKDCLKHASETEQHLTNAIVEQALG